ncbi:hypothetical protein PPSIR1_06963 [Plesiocystis pacifica SIR-1]|uniref:NADH-quinone oxidoreductase subunit K n=1 Tax=Plesiocystis pacifica SIR-1 TaxID=391625 RepID=A6G551_9BACT|nr:NADH-quinone oxidoreductase subunit K [Plesiocystis pacifica]EDM78963.1 hypothetical protein PPSIR1_06963 [Plesiocystis pacifica SIR-1]
MLPTTHYLYFGIALFALGLGGAALRRSLIAVLLSVQLMFMAAAVLLCAYVPVHGAAQGRVAALLIVLVGFVEVTIAAAVVVRAIRSGEPESSPVAWLEDWAEDWAARSEGEGS